MRNPFFVRPYSRVSRKIFSSIGLSPNSGCSSLIYLSASTNFEAGTTSLTVLTAERLSS
ncbi:hypothetical protein BCEP4_590023 [Burkholderia cepacia]|nr:hypothetical protein BCEP4_590023 [Burkholderia cepacia]